MLGFAGSSPAASRKRAARQPLATALEPVTLPTAWLLVSVKGHIAILDPHFAAISASSAALDAPILA